MLRLSLVTAIASLSFTLALFAQKDKESAGIEVNKEKRFVAIDAKVAPRKLEHLKGEIYPVEVVACFPYPKGQKAHETVVTIEVKPSEVHKALEAIGLKPGKPVKGGETPCTGPDLNLYIEVPSESGSKRVSIDKILIDPKTKKPFPKSVKFRFTGSAMTQPDPTKPETVYGADSTGTLIAIYPVTNETVCQSSLTMKEEKFLKLDVNTELLPKEGTKVRLILEDAKSQ